MKKNIHPKYQEVLFVDSSTGQKSVIGSTLQTQEKEVYKGKEYPVCRVSVSSFSHPFFTGSKQLVDAEGRVDKFNKRYSGSPVKQAAKEDAKEQKKKQSKEAEAKGSKTKKK